MNKLNGLHVIPPTFALSLKLSLATVAYLLLTWIVLAVFSPERGASLFYLTTGYALAITLLGGKTYLIAVFAGSLLVNLVFGDPHLSSIIGALGSMGSAWLGYTLLSRANDFDLSLSKLKDTLNIFLLGGAIGCMVSPIAGTSMLFLREIIDSQQFFYTLITWWLGDVLGVILLTPAILLWSNLLTRFDANQTPSVFEGRAIELISLLGITLLICAIIFLDLGRTQLNAPSALWINLIAEPYWLFPLVIWSSLRFHQRIVSLFILIIGGIAILGAYHGLGAFHSEHLSSSLISYWGFMVILSVTALLLNSFLNEIRQVERKLKTSISELDRLANFDALTGLPNRSLLIDRLDQVLAVCKRKNTAFALLFIDLDGFKYINDQYGHSVGDHVLNTIAHRMRNELRGTDTLARMGGDEFVALMPEITKDELEMIAKRLLKAAALPILIDNLTLQLSASIGGKLNHACNTDEYQTLLHQVDQTMYEVKSTGKNNYIIE